MLRCIIIKALLCCLLCAPVYTATGQPAKPDNGKSCFVVISDIHLVNNGTYNCRGKDTNPSLWAEAQQELRTLLATAHGQYGKPKFIVLLGDLPEHRRFNTSTGMVKSDINTVLTDLSRIDSEFNIPLIVVPGNNDPLEHDGIFKATESVGADPAGYKPGIYPVMGSPVTNLSGNPERGYYAYTPVKGLKVIALNTVVFMLKDNDYKIFAAAEIKDELNWLEKELNTNDGTDVIITMHVPPGIDAFKDASFFWPDNAQSDNGTWAQHAFLDIINKHHHKIVGLLSGHTHMDGIRKIEYSQTGNDFTVLVSCPAVSPIYRNNPAIKLIDYDDKTHQFENFTTYWYTQYNKQHSALAWDSYTFKTEFGCSTPGTIHDCIAAKSDAELTESIQHIYYTQSDSIPPRNHPELTLHVGYKK